MRAGYSTPRRRLPTTSEASIDPRLVILLGALGVAAVLDAFTKRIPNALTFSLLLVALVAQATIGDGIVIALIGAAVAFALHFALWQLKLEGAGDAKLMMGVGAMVGWQTMLEATGWRYILLFPYAALAFTVLRRWPNLLAAMRWTRDRMLGKDVGERPEPTLLPFGPLIAVAVPLAIFTDWLEIL